MKERIREKIKEIEEREDVRVLMAVESGSRAWGFASPDSDYDVRFIYVRPLKEYLRLEKTRDVIEWQLDETLDINGWDLKKALVLMHDSNPTVFEWCASPIVYRDSQAFKELKELRHRYFSPKKSLFHYWSMANGNYRHYLQPDMVPVKKYFYVLRPLLAAKWIAERNIQPPMLFSELIEAELPADLQGIVDELLAMKQTMPEMGKAPKIAALDAFIERELNAVKKAAEEAEAVKCGWTELNAFFRRMVQQ
ncbi:MAG TPA: nucleotidyltransferase domain-containing protein [Methanocorpusculum sp.]|nr:nucleotidyltransferase domain-containing protein [Methanocorpusculum sp.]